jgi:hypothetical protein
MGACITITSFYAEWHGGGSLDYLRYHKFHFESSRDATLFKLFGNDDSFQYISSEEYDRMKNHYLERDSLERDRFDLLEEQIIFKGNLA